jgi:hypothetical protein
MCYGITKARCYQAAYNMYHGSAYISVNEPPQCSNKRTDAGAMLHSTSTALLPNNFDGSLQGEL